MTYIGAEPDAAFTTTAKQTITGTGVVTYTLDHAVSSESDIRVYVDNVHQEGGTGKAYTVDGNQITFSENITSIMDCYVIFSAMALQTTAPAADSISTGMIKDDQITTAKINDGAVTAAKLASGAVSNILETLVLVCNGDSITVPSGTYTSTNVNALQALTDTHTVVNGSSISYTPPSGATSVIYEFTFMGNWEDTNGITHLKMEIDGTEVTQARQGPSYAGTYDQFRYTFKWRIPIGGTADAATGRQSSWTSAKTLRLKMRRYNGTYDVNLFERLYWDGVSNAGTAGVERPVLTITALS